MAAEFGDPQTPAYLDIDHPALRERNHGLHRILTVASHDILETQLLTSEGRQMSPQLIQDQARLRQLRRITAELAQGMAQPHPTEIWLDDPHFLCLPSDIPLDNIGLTRDKVVSAINVGKSQGTTRLLQLFRPHDDLSTPAFIHWPRQTAFARFERFLQAADGEDGSFTYAFPTDLPKMDVHLNYLYGDPQPLYSVLLKC